MKNSLPLAGLLFGALFIFPKSSEAQWQPDVPLTDDPSASYTSYNNAWSIAASGDTVHVVWTDNRDGNGGRIYYKRSTDGGISWETDRRLTSDPVGSRFPSISVSGQVVHVVWEDGRDGYSAVYYKRSTDGGTSWEADARLTNNTNSTPWPSVSVYGQVVHVVWGDGRDGPFGNNEIYYKRSTDGGTSWGPDTRLTNNSALSRYPSVAVSGSFVHVVWDDDRNGAQTEIYYKRSTDGGTSWEADARLTNDPANSALPSISVSGQVVHVVWNDGRDGNAEVYYKRSTDGGISWGADTRLTNDPAISGFSSISASGPRIHIVWQDNRDGNIEIYYKRSTDGGASWEADTRLTNSAGTSWYPSVAVSGQVMHVVWADNRDGNDEIYYKRNPTGNVTGVEDPGSEIPTAYTLEQNYPNPFNPSTTVSFSLPSESFVSLRIFDALGREVASLLAEELPAGKHAQAWNPSGLSSGVYFYRLSVVPSARRDLVLKDWQARPTDGGQAGSFIQTKKLVLLK